MNSKLVYGSVSHQRFRPVPYTLKQAHNCMLLDIDELDHCCSLSRMFNRNVSAAMAFYDKDYGREESQSVREFINDLLSNKGLPNPNKVMLLCSPRILGYVFNPLSVWLCLDEAEEIYTIVYEVRNTRGEKHHYIVHLPEGEQNTDRLPWHTADKKMYVSPFSTLDGEYSFKFSLSEEKFKLVIHFSNRDDRAFSAMWGGRFETIEKRSLHRFFRQSIFNNVKVILAIHWHALKLFLRSAPWYRFQTQSGPAVSMGRIKSNK
ncbi:DUF1365 domain-containing protein [Pseudoteredinibacter isoporae]|uniref:DUF1365 domain-containing protein n=1 Tax=Pseudoteredinibacter isoporae TaxID=570281 RepID=A0A7X0JR18_9GAMM|nr:DUF1365 domain-containing protein [Pseudoteredinibacter isoporae]MBB6520088.1 hypothetical protein [Pseudoteredinibacter isoporae]NHO85660.1 DUF1365 domain-containing protein [Pseudoteredinibacter isoporae]NIB25888.1 DUF1365 domain-containing protein [Pseudoteredinibacter isoporae]